MDNTQTLSSRERRLIHFHGPEAPRDVPQNEQESRTNSEHLDPGEREARRNVAIERIGGLINANHSLLKFLQRDFDGLPPSDAQLKQLQQLQKSLNDALVPLRAGSNLIARTNFMHRGGADVSIVDPVQGTLVVRFFYRWEEPDLGMVQWGQLGSLHLLDE